MAAVTSLRDGSPDEKELFELTELMEELRVRSRCHDLIGCVTGGAVEVS